MEIKNFYKLLKKHWLTLLLIPLAAVAVTFFLVRSKPNSYQSKTQIATGLIDQSQNISGTDDASQQDSKIQEQFNNLIETMKLDQVVDQVSFKLLLHDLTEPVPFKLSVLKYISLPLDVKNQVINILNAKLDSFATLDLNVPIERMTDSLLTKTEYDPESLLKNIVVYQADNSDFIDLEVDAETPALSAFIANNLTDKFISYYAGYENSGHSKSDDFYSKLMDDKKAAMDQKTASLEAFKAKNGILDIGDASKDMYAQISDLEAHEQQAEKDANADSGALKSINAKFDPKDKQNVEVVDTKINANILNIKDRLKTLNDKYVQSSFDPRYKTSIDSLQDVLSAQIDESSDKLASSNPALSKDNIMQDNIIQEKLKTENDLELARYSASSLKSQLNALKGKMGSLLPAQAEMQSDERDVDIATKEYLDAQDKYNQAHVSAITPIQLKQLEIAMPGKRQSSKKILLVALSGIASFVFYLFVLLVVFYMDNSIRSGEDLQRRTGMPVLGFLNIVPGKSGNAGKGRQEIKDRNDMRMYRDSLRSIRFEIDSESNGSKVLAITSLNKGEGKTLFSFGLAYAYSLANKKVLLIDGNFSNPVISETVKSKDFIEDLFMRGHFLELKNNSTPADKTVMHLLEIDNTTNIGKTVQRLSDQSGNQHSEKDLVSILGNKGGDISLMEISDENNIRQVIDELKSKYDIIIIETGSLDTLNKSYKLICCQLFSRP
jgi:succinoglycan biosynthesis transport protein ExoP